MFNFSLESTCGAARTGTFKTPRGLINTPVFMPCGTKATVKTLSNEDLKSINTQILLGNTYHLHLRPTSELIYKLGGLHKFMNWDRPILTDSGGFQVFSLGRSQNKPPLITEEGVEFCSHLDGSKHFFSPKKAIEIQVNLGADIMMVFDECAPGNSSHRYAKDAMLRTHRWAKESIQHFTKIANSDQQTIFPIVQGVVYEDLRAESAKFIADCDTTGVAIGGLSVGESKDHMYGMLDVVMPILPTNKPRYLMGVGSPEDIVEGVYRGVDMFDCVLPTRVARHGAFFTHFGRKNLTNAQYAFDQSPLMDDCNCYACTNHSKAYIHHLIRESEILGHKLLTLHNLNFLFKLTERLREAISQKRMAEFRKEFLYNWNQTV